mmetsp:Transcript_101800/g.294588  ORF Transcript_101800/g.294588 Transcript_101800/m.294588 type:complete len:261 (-) Transcript_101800:246-1028(-)
MSNNNLLEATAFKGSDSVTATPKMWYFNSFSSISRRMTAWISSTSSGARASQMRRTSAPFVLSTSMRYQKSTWPPNSEMPWRRRASWPPPSSRKTPPCDSPGCGAPAAPGGGLWRSAFASGDGDDGAASAGADRGGICVSKCCTVFLTLGADDSAATGVGIGPPAWVVRWPWLCPRSCSRLEAALSAERFSRAVVSAPLITFRTTNSTGILALSATACRIASRASMSAAKAFGSLTWRIQCPEISRPAGRRLAAAAARSR